jgi:hypothetical protein
MRGNAIRFPPVPDAFRALVAGRFRVSFKGGACCRNGVPQAMPQAATSLGLIFPYRAIRARQGRRKVSRSLPESLGYAS